MSRLRLRLREARAVTAQHNLLKTSHTEIWSSTLPRSTDGEKGAQHRNGLMLPALDFATQAKYHMFSSGQRARFS